MPNSDVNMKVIGTSRDGKWSNVLVDDERYFIMRNKAGNMKIAYTPGGEAISTSYKAIADRLLDDIDSYGIDYFSPESIVPWHFTQLDNFGKMKHEQVEKILDDSFLSKKDWTLDGGINDDKWKKIFGESKERKEELRKWLSKCSHMQMTAACCIGNAHHSINIAYIVAMYMENYEGNELIIKLSNLANMIGCYSMYSDAGDLLCDFDIFILYYGIHLEEDGKIINVVIEDGESVD